MERKEASPWKRKVEEEEEERGLSPPIEAKRADRERLDRDPAEDPDVAHCGRQIRLANDAQNGDQRDEGCGTRDRCGKMPLGEARGATKGTDYA
jgi:hypothetical protein